MKKKVEKKLKLKKKVSVKVEKKGWKKIKVEKKSFEVKVRIEKKYASVKNFLLSKNCLSFCNYPTS